MRCGGLGLAELLGKAKLGLGHFLIHKLFVMPFHIFLIIVIFSTSVMLDWALGVVVPVILSGQKYPPTDVP